MTHHRLTAVDRSLLQLATQRRTGVLNEGRLYERLAREHNLNLAVFWTRMAILRTNPEARESFPTTIAWLDRLHEQGLARRDRLRGAA